MPSIAAELKTEIEAYAHAIPRTNRLYLAAERGRLTKSHVTAYVSGLRFQILGTMAVMRRAEKRAAVTGNAALAEYYRNKIAEESGHDRWAEDDLAALDAAGRTSVEDSGHPALARLTAYLDAVVEEDPTLFLSYLFFAEYLTVLVGDSWLRTLNDGCGIPQTMVSVVANHVELDREHAAEGMREIDAFASQRHRERMLQVLWAAMSFCEQFWDEVLDAPARAA